MGKSRSPVTSVTRYVDSHFHFYRTPWHSQNVPTTSVQILVAWHVQDIHKFICSCSVCAQAKVPHTLLTGKLLPLPIPQTPWSQLAINLVTDLLSLQNNVITIVVNDHPFTSFLSLACHPPSKWQSSPSSMCLGTLESQRTLWVMGELNSHLWLGGFMEKLDVSVSRTSWYHPLANGQVERANQEAGHFLQT